MRPRVIQWSTGFTGRFALQYLLRNPGLDLVGVKCFGAEIEGRDAGEIAGLDPVGVFATQNVVDLLALKADCVVYMPSDPEVGDLTKLGTRAHELFEAVLPILENGTNVVSVLTSLIGPQFLGPGGEQIVTAIEAACQRGGSTFLATGFRTRFHGRRAVALYCEHVRRGPLHSVVRDLDYSDYDNLQTLQAVGLCVQPELLAGQSPEALLNVWRSVPNYVARGIGAELDDVRLVVDFRPSPETFVTHRGITVEKGAIAGLRFSVEGIVAGEPVIAVEHISRMRDDIAPEWPNLLPGGGYRIEIEGSNPVHPDFHLSLPGGTRNSFGDAMSATAARAVNSVQAACEASPGFKTFYDLPMITGRHSFRDARQAVLTA
ncbi:hypothetical protein NWT09_12055 [Mycolicibacterium sp. jd]|uniref:hypothetical protein n=1 Tax=unclassified Mycolicibacterium TaxID=2636767 RepID=UPI00351B36C4